MTNEGLKFGALGLGIALVILIIVLIFTRHKDKYKHVGSSALTDSVKKHKAPPPSAKDKAVVAAAKARVEMLQKNKKTGETTWPHAPCVNPGDNTYGGELRVNAIGCPCGAPSTGPTAGETMCFSGYCGLAGGGPNPGVPGPMQQRGGVTCPDGTPGEGGTCTCGYYPGGNAFESGADGIAADPGLGCIPPTPRTIDRGGTGCGWWLPRKGGCMNRVLQCEQDVSDKWAFGGDYCTVTDPRNARDCSNQGLDSKDFEICQTCGTICGWDQGGGSPDGGDYGQCPLDTFGGIIGYQEALALQTMCVEKAWTQSSCPQPNPAGGPNKDSGVGTPCAGYGKMVNACQWPQA